MSIGASFTMELQTVLEYTDDIGLGDYPIFAESYREHLNSQIKMHFHNREIGCETVQMFRLWMKRRMWQIMPLYNKMYLAEQLNIDPLRTIDISTVGTGHGQGTNSAEGETHSTTEGTGRVVASDYPQSRLAGNQDYATSGTDSSSTSGVTGSSTETGTNEMHNESSSHVTGSQGHQAQLIVQYRESLVSVDMLVIAELEDLFMSIWSIPDQYTYTTKGCLS